VITMTHSVRGPSADGAPSLQRTLSEPLAASAPAGDAVAWRPVVGFEDLYEVSSAGDIRSKRSFALLSKSLMGSGYQKAELYKNGERTQTSVHRVVASAFLKPVEGKEEVNHIDGDKLNNNVRNLEWASRSDNEIHSRYVLGNLVKPVKCINAESGAIERYGSISEAARFGYDATHIAACIAGRRKTHAGMTWHLDSARPPAPAVEVREALEFYANPDNWINTPSWDGDPECITPKAIPVTREDGRPCDCGDTARKALAALAASPGPSEPSPSSRSETAWQRPRWPRAGDKMTFLGKNGYDYELQAAMKIFEVGAEYTVRGCDVGDWRHTISFEGKPGHFNGVMFARIAPDCSGCKPSGVQKEDATRIEGSMQSDGANAKSGGAA